MLIKISYYDDGHMSETGLEDRWSIMTVNLQARSMIGMNCGEQRRIKRLDSSILQLA
jgi:hypothetical protein